MTLIELLVTLAVLGILLTIGVPAMQSFTIKNRLAAINNDLMAALMLTRSEAVKRGKTVTLCSSSTGNSCGGTWSDGWIVYVGTDTANPLRVQAALPATYTVNSGSGIAGAVAYNNQGVASSGGTFVVCHDGDLNGARGIVMTTLRPRVALDTDGDGIPNNDTGNITSCTSP